jgi:Tfp pilus assembly protein PilF
MKWVGVAPSTTRFYLYTVLGIASAGLCLQIASLGPLRNSFWGFHLYAFLHPFVGILAWALLVIAAAALLRPLQSEGPTDGKGSPLTKHSTATAIAFAALCGILFWLFRTQHAFLGDASSLEMDLARGQDFHPRQPLTMWLQQALYRYLGPLIEKDGMAGEDLARRVVAVGSVVAGFLFALVAVALGRLFVRNTKHRPEIAWLVALILLTQGYVLLFFGYVENYTFYALTLGIYIYVALRFIEGTSPLLLPGFVVILALTLHLSAAVLVPSFLVLALWALARREKRMASLIDLSICAAVFLAIQIAGSRFWDYGLLSSLFDVAGRAFGQEGSLIPDYMMSARHLRDFFNEQFLIGPFALFAFLPAAVMALRLPGRWSIATVFLLTLGVTYLAACVMAGDSNIGYARNWDLLAPAGVCFTAAALYFLVTHVPPSVMARRLLVFVLVASCLHAVPWVWVNHSESAAARRFETLPLGLGRTEVVMGSWHLRSGRREEATRWFDRAIAVNPNSAPAYAFLGMLFVQDERYEDARMAQSRAVALRPDKLDFRHNYVMTLIKLERDEEALPHIERLIQDAPDRVLYWQLAADILMGLGRTDEVRMLLQRYVELYPDDPNAEWARRQLQP